MAEDDGSEVAIESQFLIRWYDGQWRHYVYVCNKTDQVQDTWIETYPYETNDEKMGEPVGKRLVLGIYPPNDCKLVSFDVPAVPSQYYTDVYEYDAKEQEPLRDERYRHHYNVDVLGISAGYDLYDIYKRVLEPAGTTHQTASMSVPYPRSLEPDGRAREFYVRGVRGLPAGWCVRSTWPGIDESFTLTPDEKEFPLRVEFEIDGSAIDPDLDAAVIHVDVGIRGFPFEPPYTVPLRLSYVRKDEPPRIDAVTGEMNPHRPTVEFEATLTDRLGLLDSPDLHYSTDGGRTWRREIMRLDRVERLNDRGLVRGTFVLNVRVPRRDASVLASLVAFDHLGYTNRTPTIEFPGQYGDSAERIGSRFAAPALVQQITTLRWRLRRRVRRWIDSLRA